MGRPRDRASASGLLPRMEARVGKKATTYRYHPPGGKPIKLGRDKAEAIRKVLDLRGAAGDHGTVNELWRTYQTMVYWTRLSRGTHDDYTKSSVPLLRVFGKVAAPLITPADIARYLRRERAEAPVRANREIALLSNLLNVALERGDITRNPCREVRRNTEVPRDVAPDPKDFSAFVTWLAKQTPRRAVLATMAEFAAVCGYRQVEFLDMTLDQIDLPGRTIRTARAKQHGRSVTEQVQIAGGAVDIVERVLALPRPEGSDLVFTTERRRGAYTASGFQTMYQRAQRAALAEKVITTRFAFHDLRAFYTTQHMAESGTLPDLHASPNTTARVYNRTKVRTRSSLKG